MTSVGAETLRILAGRVQRLLPSRRDPEAYHHEREDIAYQLRKLARRVEIARSRETG